MLMLWRYNFDFSAMTVMPAIWLRQGFLIPSLDTGEANVVLAAVMVLANLAWLTNRDKNPIEIEN